MLSGETVEKSKLLVHQLTNNSQRILGYLELGDVVKALAAAKDGITTLTQLSQVLGTAYDHERSEINTQPKKRGVTLITGGTTQ